MAKQPKKPLVPDYGECWDRYMDDRRMNPLERFVLDNEPAGTAAERKFRKGLEAALRYVLSSSGVSDP